MLYPAWTAWVEVESSRQGIMLGRYRAEAAVCMHSLIWQFGACSFENLLEVLKKRMQAAWPCLSSHTYVTVPRLVGTYQPAARIG